jgi:hypothetical protein
VSAARTETCEAGKMPFPPVGGMASSRWSTATRFRDFIVVSRIVRRQDGLMLDVCRVEVKGGRAKPNIMGWWVRGLRYIVEQT